MTRNMACSMALGALGAAGAGDRFGANLRRCRRVDARWRRPRGDRRRAGRIGRPFIARRSITVRPVYRPVYVAPPVYVVQPYYRHDRGRHRGWAKKGYAPYG